MIQSWQNAENRNTKYESCAVPEELFAAIKEIVTPEEMEVAVFSDDKQTREENVRAVTEKLEEAFAENKSGLQFFLKLYISIRRRRT